MGNSIRFAALLLVALAAAPAAAEPQRLGMKLQSMDALRFDEPTRARYGPALWHRLFNEDEEILPAWTLPFGTGPDERDRRGVTFSIRPGRGLKARARVRF